eukprot:CAMPEP_0197879674 /NCGR_PEP_ID=MMETSP1439-20131203/7696_1 /TAXON_ID=66791 /ORGANISM="Gonyaulax spinifera, Strain CCMP409" /LENGTH=546 /DNA_ID=CAMNT_0043499197 /DNA_START=44 /DNA_END=1684 /DNA_ORIENTATION=+
MAGTLQDARKALEDGNCEEAVRNAELVLSSAKGASNAEDMMDAVKVLVPALIALDKLEDARLQVKEILAQFKTSGNKPGLASMLVATGDLSNAEKEPSKALDIAAEVEDLIPSCGTRDKVIKMQLLQMKVNSYLLQSKGSDAMVCAKELRSLASTNNDKEGEAAAWQAIASVHQLQETEEQGVSTADDVLQAAESALKIFQGIGNKNGEATALNTMARAQLRLDKVSTGMKTAEDALEKFKELGQSRGVVSVLETIVQAQSILGKPAAGLQVAQKELASARQAGRKRAEADVLDMITQTYAMLGQPRGAMQFAKQALDVYCVLGDKTGQGSLYHTMAEMQRSLGDMAEGTRFAEQSLAAFRAASCKWGEEQALQTLSTLMVERGFPEKAPLRSQVQKALKDLQKAVQQKQADDVKAAEAKLNSMASMLADGEVAGVLVPLLQRDPSLVTFLEEQGWEFKKESSTDKTKIKTYPHNAFYLQMIMTGMNFGPQFRGVHPFRVGDPGDDHLTCLSVSVVPETEAWQMEMGFRPGIMDSGLQCQAMLAFP